MKSAVRRAAIQGIAGNRESVLGGVDADLMGPPGTRPDEDYIFFEMAAAGFEQFEFGFGVGAGSRAALAGITLSDAHERRVNGELRFGRRINGFENIFFANFALGELLC